MFESSPYDLKRFATMRDNCPDCDLKFEREPGFFYGAMYVSYALSVGIFLVTAFILYFVAGDPSVNTYIITVAAVATLLYPLNFRYSRVIFLNIFGGVKYNPSRKGSIS